MSEEEDKLELSRWLFEHGFYVYWEHNNVYGYPRFDVKGKRAKPDLLIRRKENPDWYNTVMEVKQPNGADVRDGSKILRYWQDYTNCETTYSVDGHPVFPKYFLLATRCSISGRLFESDTDLKPVGDGRSTAIDAGLLPRNEYAETFNFVRHLWATWRDTYKRSAGTSVGALLSSVLDDNGCRPAFMYEGFNPLANRWRQYWRTFA